MERHSFLKPLNINELRRLDKLLSFISKESNNTMNLTQIHGFLCAVTMVPLFIPQSLWLPIILGEGFISESEHSLQEEVLELLTKMYNSINNKMFTQMETEPQIWYKNNILSYKKASIDMIGEWCKGFEVVISIDPVWQLEDEMTFGLIHFFAKGMPKELMESNIDNEILKVIQEFKDILPKYLADLYGYWKRIRKEIINDNNQIKHGKIRHDMINYNNGCNTMNVTIH